ncbi:MAG: DUF3021 family protein [Lachnospiraceae bacterium]|nr:DUF3021 family protein [Lachnospiraceae bacterium]
MRVLSDAIKWFLYITTGVVIVTAIIFTLVGMEEIPTNTLWKILLSGFLTTIVTVLFKPDEEGIRPGSFLLHYIALCAVMSVCGICFGWISFSLAGILFMAVAVAVVYLISFAAYMLVDRKQAEEINKLLKEKYSEEE